MNGNSFTSALMTVAGAGMSIFYIINSDWSNVPLAGLIFLCGSMLGDSYKENEKIKGGFLDEQEQE